MSDCHRLPNFFLVGAAKCGTTSLAGYLDQHPDVFVCKPKEPNFYAFPEGAAPVCVGPESAERLHEVLLKYSVTSRDAYHGLFTGAGNRSAVGDASVRYLYEKESPDRIADDVPAARIVVILRDPVARMHSHYHMNLKNGIEPLGFREALAAEDRRVAEGWGWDWHYRRVSSYAAQLERYLHRFGQDRVLVLFHADLSAAPDGVWEALCAFLGVDPGERPDFGRRALVGRTPRSPGLQRLVWEDNPIKSLAKRVLPAGLRKTLAGKVNTANVQAVPRLSPNEHADLAEWFVEDKQRVEALLGRPTPW